MKNHDIINMVAGREIDALVAERIFRWKWVTGILAFDAPCLISPNHYEKTKDRVAITNKRRVGGTFPHYSTEIADAWQVLEVIRSRQIPVEIRGDEWYDGGAWVASIYNLTGSKRLFSAQDETSGSSRKSPNGALAICRVGLLFYSQYDKDY